MKAKYNKNYFEEYAKISLTTCYDKALSQLKKSECPDFQSDELDIGLEITEAITDIQGEHRFIINEYFGKGLDGNAIKHEAEKRFKVIKNKITVLDNVAIYSEHNGWYDFNIHLKQIRQSFEDKTKKLNTSYKKFSQNWLYIFTHNSLVLENDLQIFIKDYRNENEVCFNRIFINCIDKIYIIDDFKTIEVIEVKNTDLEYIKRIALETAHKDERK